MPSLPIAKHRTGRALGNRAPIADAAESAFCAFIAAAALLGVGLNTWLGWWLADPAAAAAGIERSDPAAAGIVGGVLQTARHGRFLNTVVTTAPQVTAYLVEHSADMRPEPCVERLIVAALEVRATQPGTAQSRGVPAGSLTAAELRILKLLPTSTYLQIAATLFVSRNTVKAHLRSGLLEAGGGVALGSLERAVDLRLL